MQKPRSSYWKRVKQWNASGSCLPIMTGFISRLYTIGSGLIRYYRRSNVNPLPLKTRNCLSISYISSLKALKLAVLLLLSPLYFFAQQQTLTGLWIGALSNDSTTVRQDQSFEIALTEYRGKVYGYSRSEFIVNDTLYYIVKRVKGTITGDVCEVKDDEIISFNFPGKRDKGVKLISTFLRNKKDSTWYLSGTWKTGETKKYYSVTGKVRLMEEKDLNASKIFPHLEELNIAKDVAFYKDRKTIPI